MRQLRVPKTERVTSLLLVIRVEHMRRSGRHTWQLLIGGAIWKRFVEGRALQNTLLL